MADPTLESLQAELDALTARVVTMETGLEDRKNASEQWRSYIHSSRPPKPQGANNA